MKQKNKQVSLIIKTKRCLNTNKREQSDNKKKTKLRIKEDITTDMDLISTILENICKF